VDPRDPATTKLLQKKAPPGFVAALGSATLKGARLGVVRRVVEAGWSVAPVAKEALAALTAAGAVLVDVELSSSAYDDAELEVLLFELKADMDAYLGARGGPMRQLADLVAFNEAHAEQELPYFGQQHFLAAVKKGPLTSPAYVKALATCKQARGSLHALLEKHRLDALVAPTEGPAWQTDFALGDHFTFSFSTPAAVGGCPHLTVPMGFVGELPVGLSFVGAAGSDAQVLALGHAFELATHARKPPRYFAR
jgi:amidase